MGIHLVSEILLICFEGNWNGKHYLLQSPNNNKKWYTLDLEASLAMLVCQSDFSGESSSNKMLDVNVYKSFWLFDL